MADRSAPALHFGPPRPWGFWWLADRPQRMQRASAALATDEGLWLVDPVAGPGLAAALAERGPVLGVLQLLDRHPRDCRALATAHGVPLHRNPVAGVASSPFTMIPLTQNGLWHEVALWWEERRLLHVPEALGTAPYFRSPGLSLGIHPALRLAPPRTLLGLEPLVLLCGHGAGREGAGVADELRRAVSASRRDLPRWLAGLPRTMRTTR